MIQPPVRQASALSGRARARPHKDLMVLQVEVVITTYEGFDFDRKRPLHSRLEWRDAKWEDVAGSFEIGKGG